MAKRGSPWPNRKPPELILLDFVLPGLRGDEVCRRLAGSARTGGIPVVLMSSSTKDMLNTEAECRNVVKTISKPFTPELLCATVNAISREAAGRRAGGFGIEGPQSAERRLMPAALRR